MFDPAILRSKSVLMAGQPGLRDGHLLDAIVDEFAENEDQPNTECATGVFAGPARCRLS